MSSPNSHAVAPWLHDITQSQVAAFGEIMATAKAQARANALLAGQNPDAAHLLKI